jgi:hypothetical protein
MELAWLHLRKDLIVPPRIGVQWRNKSRFTQVVCVGLAGIWLTNNNFWHFSY